eukprot:m.433792 g.433792  ORF g.433792 m.433792 type:complete len:630 (-) comp17618_c0_seq1:1865-3754(-)
MATKLSFRARALDATKPLPVYRSEDEPDILKEAAISRGVMEMATGMEKEEEEEIHIRQVIHQENPLENAVVIPVPEARSAEIAAQDGQKFALPKQYIRSQIGWGLEEDVPTYDMDTDDEGWLEKFNAERSKSPKDPPVLTVDKFELILGRIESMMSHGPVRPADLVSVSGDEQDLYCTILEYAQQRVKHLERPTITPMIKPDNPNGSSVRDAYVAFRARTEKMQTRKSQKNQESSYVNMLKLHRDMIRCRDIIDLVKKREAKKLELLRTRQKIVDARFAMQDWTGAILEKCTPQPVLKVQLPLRHPEMVDNSLYDQHHQAHASMSPEVRRQRVIASKKRKVRDEDSPSIFARPNKYASGDGFDDDLLSDEDDAASSESSAVTEDEYEHDEPFRLRRRYNMFYHAPLAELPNRIASAGQYQLARRVEETHPRPALRGFCRRRIGRGGRLFIDRCRPDHDFQGELTRVTLEQKEDLRHQQAKVQDFYAIREERRQRESNGLRSTDAAGAAAVHGDADDSAGRGARRGATSEKAANPYAKSYSSGGRDRLPPAGANFGSGGENVKSGPFVRLVGQPLERQGSSGWMPVKLAAATKQAVGPDVKLAPSPTKQPGVEPPAAPGIPLPSPPPPEV